MRLIRKNYLVDKIKPVSKEIRDLEKLAARCEKLDKNNKYSRNSYSQYKWVDSLFEGNKILSNPYKKFVYVGPNKELILDAACEIILNRGLLPLSQYYLVTLPINIKKMEILCKQYPSLPDMFYWGEMLKLANLVLEINKSIKFSTKCRDLETEGLDICKSILDIREFYLGAI